MRTGLRRAEFTLRREVRLFDEITFARLCRARDYLGDCYADRITLVNSARKACLSPFHFNRLFARAFGETNQDVPAIARLNQIAPRAHLQRCPEGKGTLVALNCNK